MELNDYLGYVQDQESALRSNESQKLDFKKTYFDEKEVEMSLEQNY